MHFQRFCFNPCQVTQFFVNLYFQFFFGSLRPHCSRTGTDPTGLKVVFELLAKGRSGVKVSAKSICAAQNKDLSKLVFLGIFENS